MAKLYTYKNLQDEVLAWLDDTSTSTRTLVKNSLNQQHQKRLTSYDWWFMLWPDAVTFSSVVNQTRYSLHSEFYKPYYFFNQTTKSYLVEMNNRQLGPSGVRWNTDTGISRFMLWGRSPLSTIMPAAGTLKIVSSSASDTTPTVTFVGTNSTGTGLISETLTANGTTTRTGSKTFNNPILSVTLSAAFVGTLTISTGSTTLAVLEAGELGRSYPQMQLLSLPQSIDVIEYRFYRQPRSLDSDNDFPDIPPPFSQILVWDTLLDMGAYNTDTKAQNMAVWTQNRNEIFDQMIRANDEASSLESEPRYVRSLGEEPDGPRIYSS